MVTTVREDLFLIQLGLWKGLYLKAYQQAMDGLMKKIRAFCSHQRKHGWGMSFAALCAAGFIRLK